MAMCEERYFQLWLAIVCRWRVKIIMQERGVSFRARQWAHRDRDPLTALPKHYLILRIWAHGQCSNAIAVSFFAIIFVFVFSTRFSTVGSGSNLSPGFTEGAELNNYFFTAFKSINLVPVSYMSTVCNVVVRSGKECAFNAADQVCG